MVIKKFLIEQLGKALAGSQFARIVGSVQRAEKAALSTKLSGSEKKDKVLEELKVIGVELSSWFGYLLIELAVAVVKIEAGKIIPEFKK